MISPWVRALTEEFMPGSKLRIGGYYRHPDDGVIVITGGSYWGQHGVSNSWVWRVIATGHTHHGYGGDFGEVPPMTIPDVPVHHSKHDGGTCDGGAGCTVHSLFGHDHRQCEDNSQQWLLLQVGCR